jgi:hypothetical protein
MLAAFSLPHGQGVLNLRQERYRLKTFVREFAATRGRAICARVEREEGVRFREFIERLPKDRAPDGDTALRHVLHSVGAPPSDLFIVSPVKGTLFVSKQIG